MKNEDITLKSLPAVGDMSAISKFASSFNGYEHYGSFKATADASEASRNSERESLTGLRNELFFSWRASRQGMGDEFVERYEELYPHFVKILQ